MKPPAGQRLQGRRIKVNAASLDMNFYLKNLSGRRLSTAVLSHGVTSGWKHGSEIWPRDVSFLEIGLIKLARSQG
jgi:hypothetical protein